VDATGVAKAVVESGATSHSTNPTGMENVDRIREIIFGSQMRDYEQRFSRIEERILKETADLKSETKRRLDSLEMYIRQEVDSLADRLASEKSERAASDDKMAKEFLETATAIERRMSQFDDRAAHNLRELRQLTLDQHKSMLEEFSQKTADLSSSAERRIEEVRTASVQRSTMANLLTELALRLEGQFSLPHAEGIGNGGVQP
jgi:hypothetical protein